MKIAKEFKWEMGHRLPFHLDKCRNLHGHSYKMLVEIEGSKDENGMVLDYYDMKKVVGPLVDELDHAFMVYDKDKELIEVLDKLESKYVLVEFHSTAENMVNYFADKIKETGLPDNINSLKIRIYETSSTYAEEEFSIK